MEKLHYIKDEMLAHIPICTHADPKSVLLIGGCDNLYAEVQKYKTIETIERVETDEAPKKIASLAEKSFDVIIVAVENFKGDRVFFCSYCCYFS